MLETGTKPVALLAHRSAQRDNRFIIASRKNVSYSITDTRTGVTKYHRLGPTSQVLDEFGRIIEIGKDAICTRVMVQEKAKSPAMPKTLRPATTLKRCSSQ